VRQKSGRKGLLARRWWVNESRISLISTMYFMRPRKIGSRVRRPASGKRVLVAEASAFSRGLIRSGLDMRATGFWKRRIWRRQFAGWSSMRWTLS